MAGAVRQLLNQSLSSGRWISRSFKTNNVLPTRMWMGTSSKNVSNVRTFTNNAYHLNGTNGSFIKQICSPLITTSVFSSRTNISHVNKINMNQVPSLNHVVQRQQQRTYLKHTWQTLVHTKGNSEFPSVAVHGNKVSHAYSFLHRKLVQSKVNRIFDRQRYFERGNVKRRRKNKEYIATLFRRKLEIKLLQSSKYDQKLAQELKHYDGI